MRAKAEGHNLSISLKMLPALELSVAQNENRPHHQSLSRISPELDYRYNCFQSSPRKWLRDGSTSAFSTLHFQPCLFNFCDCNFSQIQHLHVQLWNFSTLAFSTQAIFNFSLFQLLTNSTFPKSTFSFFNFWQFQLDLATVSPLKNKYFQKVRSKLSLLLKDIALIS